MPPPAISVTPRLSVLISSPSSRTCRPPPRSRNVSTPRHLLRAVKFGCRKSGIGFRNITGGESIVIAPLKVMSYLPDSDDSPRKKMASSISPKLQVNSAEQSLGDSPLVRKLDPSKTIILDAFRGKSGCVSFSGLSHQLVDARKLVSSPFEDGKGSLIWIVAPVALISSLLLPQFYLNNAIEAFVKNEVLTG